MNNPASRQPPGSHGKSEMRPVPYQSPDKGSFFFVAKARFGELFRQILHVLFLAVPKTPRPPGKAGRYEYSQRGFAPLATPRFAFRKEKAAKNAADIMDRKPEI